MVEGGFDAEAYLEQVRLLLREAKVALGGKPKGYRATNALAFAHEADALTDDPANRDTPVEVRLAFGDMAARPSLMTDRLTAKGLLAKSVTGLVFLHAERCSKSCGETTWGSTSGSVAMVTVPTR